MIFLLFAVLLAASYTYFKSKVWRAEKVTSNIPGDKTLPILGNSLYLWQSKDVTHIWSLMTKYHARYQEHGILKFWVGPIIVIGLWDPAFIEVVASSPHTRHKGPIYKMIFGDVLNGIFVDDGSNWKELRTTVNKIFTKTLMVNDYFEVFVRRSRSFQRFLKDNVMGEERNIGPDIGRLVCDIVGESLFGVTANELEENTLNIPEELDKFLSLRFQSALKYNLYFYRHVMKFTKAGKIMEECISKLNSFLQIVLDRRRASTRHPESGEFYSDYVLRRVAEKNLSDADARKELADMAGAAVDTSAVLLSSSFLFLAMFPEVQELAHREQEDVLGDSDREPTYRELLRMEYLDRVVKETLRLVAPPGILKVCTQDVPMGDYTLPKGAYLYLISSSVHRDPKFWERPLTFHPDHFLPEKTAARPRYAYMPFGVGPRSCPGYQYGLNMTKVILSTVLRKYTLQTSKKYEELRFSFKIMLEPKHGYPVRFEERK